MGCPSGSKMMILRWLACRLVNLSVIFEMVRVSSISVYYIPN